MRAKTEKRFYCRGKALEKAKTKLINRIILQYEI